MDASSIVYETEMYSNLSLIFMVIAITCGISTIVIWFVFNISHSISVLTGLKTKVSMKDLAEGKRHADTGKAVISWNTSGALTKSAVTDAVIPPVEETVVLDNETELLDDWLKTNEESPSGFELEDDIMITGSDKSI